jgi:cytochrome oxidase Cu insertion factor (SCO1/SenC/PrrC family)
MMTWSILVLIAAFFSQAPGAAPPARIDLSKLGPKVGERVPDFSLKDQNGKVWTLESITGTKGAMLVFVRSADW